MKTWYIGLDPGHGGSDKYNVGPTGYVEAEAVLEMALACREELLKKGYKVFLTRYQDQSLSIKQRANLLNRAGVDLVVSIHTNAAANHNIRGGEAIHSIRGGRGKHLAEMLLQHLVKDLQIPKRRIYSRKSGVHPNIDYYGIIRRTKMTCVILEVEFHTNPVAEALLKNAVFRRKAGRAIAHGIIDYCRSESG